VARTVFPKTNTLRPGAGETLYDLGFVAGLFFWAFGLLWLFFAVASILRARKFPFNHGWWAFTFPVGVYAACTCQLGRAMPSTFFKVLGTVCCIARGGHGVSNWYSRSSPCVSCCCGSWCRY
jgi:tellurite resistance protein TehA-like permease